MRATWTDRLPEAYFVACSILLLLVMTGGSSEWLFWLLFFATFPMSLYAYCVTYVGGGILFGLAESGASLAFAVLVWTSAIALQAGALRALCRARRSHRSTGGSLA